MLYVKFFTISNNFNWLVISFYNKLNEDLEQILQFRDKVWITYAEMLENWSLNIPITTLGVKIVNRIEFPNVSKVAQFCL